MDRAAAADADRDTAWQLAQAWPSAELRVIEDSGHIGSPAMRNAILEALARFGGSGQGVWSDDRMQFGGGRG
ncbi:hypothetical protein ACIHDR_05080 [Nocardia sp. NPDC052278]|uniref:hypothetical protein n=1 Tax=unclassified Nocardia TaxID=2637762 RepID=UPI003678A4A3